MKSLFCEWAIDPNGTSNDDWDCGYAAGIRAAIRTLISAEDFIDFEIAAHEVSSDLNAGLISDHMEATLLAGIIYDKHGLGEVVIVS